MKDNRTHTIQVRLTTKELSELRNGADELGVTLSVYIRLLIRQGQGKPFTVDRMNY